MRYPLMLTSILIGLTSSSALAQTTTATGTGVAVSRSNSAANAVAISGQGGKGGNSTSSLVVNSNVPAVTSSTINNTGTQTIRNVPTEFAPGLTAAGLETCLGSVSGGGAFVGTGFSFGSTIPDAGCAARLDARTMWSMGLKKAAVARLCLMSDIYRSMPEVCVLYLPQPPSGYISPVALAPASDMTYSGGPILLVEGSTGKNRLCNDYDEAHQRCRKWAYIVSHHPPKKKMAVNITPAAQPAEPIARSADSGSAETKEGK